MLRFVLPLVFIVASLPALAQKRNFTTAELFQNKLPSNFYQPLPGVIRWIDDENVLLRKKPHPDSASANVVLNIKTGKTQPFIPASTVAGNPAEKSVVVRNNDLYLLTGNRESRLTNNADEEKNPTFSPDSNYIAYTRANDLFTYDLRSNKENQLTTDGTSTTLNGYASWVYWEEIFGRPTRFRAFWWSPDSKTLAYMRFDESMIPMFPIYNSEGQYGSLEETRYPKAGDRNPEVKIGLVNAAGGSTVWADFNEKKDQYFGWPVWNPVTHELWVSWMNRRQDSLKIFAVNNSNGAKTEVYAESQKTWIQLEDGAGGRITYLDDNKGFILQSDRTGWNHLYLYAVNGSFRNAITSGNFTVTEVKHIDQKKGIIYFVARGRENTARSDLYSVKLNGKDLRRLTFGDYHHASVSISPSAKYFITTYSNSSTPHQMAVVTTAGKMVHQLGNMGTGEIGNYELAKTELIRIKSADGLFELPAVVTWPANYDRNKKYPLLISIYGGPDAGTVWDSWQWNVNRQWYAQEGLIQVAFDHRASGHFGKHGQNFIHRNLGYWEMEDYTTMTKWFIENAGADPARICITGFSYGGYLSAYALTYKADVFTHGMAGGTVVDWRLYDTHYTERFMQTPQSNPEGYRASAVLTHVDKYRGMLQIVHGTMDDNVHLQNSLQLISALQDRKMDFEFMLYPGGKHGWPNLPAKTQHYNNLKTDFIYKYLLKKPVPAGLKK